MALVVSVALCDLLIVHIMLVAFRFCGRVASTCVSCLSPCCVRHLAYRWLQSVRWLHCLSAPALCYSLPCVGTSCFAAPIASVVLPRRRGGATVRTAGMVPVKDPAAGTASEALRLDALRLR